MEEGSIRSGQLDGKGKDKRALRNDVVHYHFGLLLLLLLTIVVVVVVVVVVVRKPWPLERQINNHSFCTLAGMTRSWCCLDGDGLGAVHADFFLSIESQPDGRAIMGRFIICIIMQVCIFLLLLVQRLGLKLGHNLALQNTPRW